MKKLALILLIPTLLLSSTPKELVADILGLSGEDVKIWSDAMVERFGSSYSFGVAYDDALQLTARAVVNEVSPDVGAGAVYSYVESLKMGADPDEAFDISEIGFSDPISGEQIYWASRSRIVARQKGLDLQIVDELILDAVINGRSGELISILIDGLSRGRDRGVREDRFAIALLIRQAGEDLDRSSLKSAIDEEIRFLLSHRTVEQVRVDQLIDSLRSIGLSSSLLREVVALSLEEGWGDSALATVLLGAGDAYSRGLTVERFIVAITLSIALDPEGDIVRMVSDDLTFVANLPQERARLESRPKETPKKVDSVDIKRVRKPSLDEDLLHESMNKFLTARAPQTPSSTPYLWGGVTRKGVDCSGFTSVCYAESGFVIPRVSRDQYSYFLEKGQNVTDDYRFGDLLFFAANGPGSRITHVGIYYGKDGGDHRFIHSSSTPGVNIASLYNNPYWSPRYVGAVRVVP